MFWPCSFIRNVIRMGFCHPNLVTVLFLVDFPFPSINLSGLIFIQISSIIVWIDFWYPLHSCKNFLRLFPGLFQIIFCCHRSKISGVNVSGCSGMVDSQLIVFRVPQPWLMASNVHSSVGVNWLWGFTTNNLD